MIKLLIGLEWKEFRRASNFQQSLVVKIFMILGILYLTGISVLVAFGAYFGTKESYPNSNPLELVNKYIFYWFLLGIVYRFFLQKLPTMNVRPLMLFPIKKTKVIHLLLLRTVISPFNLFPFAFYLTYFIILLTQNYAILQVITWFLVMIAVELSVNYLNFLVNKKISVFFVVLSFLLGLIALQYYNIVDFTILSGWIFNAFLKYEFLLVMPILMLFLVYRLNFNYVRKNFYLEDKAFNVVIKEVSTSEMKWLDRFGEMSIFIKNDLRLIWRNKRPRQTLLAAVFFLFYGLFIFLDKQYMNSIFMPLLASLIITGGFMMTFGQSVPAWDSEYYKLLMCQNISYSKYLRSKWWLMVLSVFVTLIFSIPYVYFGRNVLEMLVAVSLFNVGVNSYITILGGVYNKKPIKLNVKAKAFENMQGFSFTQVLISLPKIFGPFVIFYPLYQFYNYHVASIGVAVVGIVGLLLKNPIFRQIEKIYLEEKYDTITAFNE